MCFPPFDSMPLPATTGGSGLTRSEAAIEAWKHRQRAQPKPGTLNPKIAARVKEILAAKQKKAGPKGKAKGKTAKPKDARTSQEKKNQNRASVAKQGGMDKLEGVMVRLGAGMNSDLEKDAHDELISKGLAKRGADGKPKLTPAGRKWRSAADKGDADGAGAALAEGRGAASESAAKDKEKSAKAAERATAKAEREKAKGAKVAERAAKQKKQQQAAKQKAQARQKIAAEKAKAKAAKEAAKLKPAPANPTADATTPAQPTKAWNYAIKQTSQERAMFASMDDTGTRKTPKGEGDSGGASGGGSSSGGGPGGRATLRPKVSGDTAAHARFVAQKRASVAARAKRRAEGADRKKKAKANISKIDAIQKELKKRNVPIARLHELRQQLSDIRSGKALDMSDELAIKAGARHSKTDLQHLQGIHDSAVACGASCGAEDAPADEEAETAIKGIMDNPAWYASHECGDVMQACSALQTLAMLIQSELSEEDEDDASIGQLCDAAETLLEFIQGELSELRGAAGDAAELPNSASVQTMKAATDDAWLHMDGGAIKAMDGDTIKGMAVLYGTKSTHDLEKDYYDKNTDLWLDHWGWPRPITYHHGMDAGTRDDPVIGHWLKATVTDEGVWLEGQLNRAHRYYKAIKELAQRGYLKISSDSGPQWTIREPQSNGANYIKRWPLVSASVTVTPMEPRMFPVEIKAFLVELGYEAIDTDSPEAVKATSDRPDGAQAESERARRLVLELSLLQLEETAL